MGPWDVAVDTSGNVYTVEANDNHRVQKFDCNGNFITTWGSLGSGNGEFENPLGVAVDLAGNVYVADTGNGRIQKFDGDGNFIANLFAPGTGFRIPSGVTVDASGSVYVSDDVRVLKFDRDGNFITSWDSPCTFDVDVDDHGNVYSVELCTPLARMFTGGSSFVWGTDGGVDGQFLDPRGLAINSVGAEIFIYVSDFQRHDVQKFRMTPVAVQHGTWSAVKRVYRRDRRDNRPFHASRQ